MSSSRYRVIVKLKEGVLDVQGKAIESSVSELGIGSVGDVRVGRVVEFSLDGDQSGQTDDKIKEKIDKLCSELFSNPVIETYSWESL